MRRLLLVAAAIAPVIGLSSAPASAQVNAANGFPVGGGFHRGGGGFHAGWGGRGIVNRGIGWNRPGAYRAGGYWRGGSNWRGGAWRGYPRYRYGGSPYWGAAAGLATAATIGALATGPAYGYYEPEPVYPVYPAYRAIPVASGDQCSTPVKMCTLYEPAQLGVGCSCKVSGGRARGTVVP